MKQLLYIFIICISVSLLLSCEKEITVNLPKSEKKIVVEASMEQNQPPLVILSYSMGYFEPTDLNTLQQSFIDNATVTISDGSQQITLDKICTSTIPDSVLQNLAPMIGINYADLKNLNICFYTTTQLVGQIGKTYKLVVHANGETVTSTAKIPNLISPNYYWWKAQPGYNNYGYLWFNLTDPAPIGNAYRIFVKRLNKDASFVPVFGSAYNDDFSNDLTFDFYVARGHLPNSTAPEDHNETAYYFEKKDTLIVKFCTIDQGVYEFYRTFEAEVYNNGNPFASPTTIQSNVDGGLGVWACYGASYDTLITQ